MEIGYQKIVSKWKIRVFNFINLIFKKKQRFELPLSSLLSMEMNFRRQILKKRNLFWTVVRNNLRKNKKGK